MEYNSQNNGNRYLLVLNSFALIIILLFVLCIAHIYMVQPKPVNPSWSLQYNNVFTFYGIPVIFVAVIAIFAYRIICSKFTSLISSLSIIVAAYSVTMLEMFSRSNGSLRIATSKVVDYYLHSYFLPQSILLPLLAFILLLYFTGSAFLSTSFLTSLYTVIALIDSGKMKFFHHHFYPSDITVALREFIPIAADCIKEYASYDWVIAILLSALLSLITYRVASHIHVHPFVRLQRVAIILIAIVLTSCASIYNVYETKQVGKRGFDYYYRSYDDYYSQSYFVGFISCLVYGTKIARPDGYSKQRIDSIIDNIKCLPFDLIKKNKLPYIIVWQSESFEDLRKYPSLQIDNDIYKIYDKIRNESIEGYVLTPNYYTINSQFEFVTSFFYKYYMPEMIVYNKIKSKISSSLGYALQKHGYSTSSLQLYANSAFAYKVNEESVYGIDDCCNLPAKKMMFAKTKRVSDMQYAETAFAFIEKRVQLKRPTVLFIQTDQNHVPHNIDEIPDPSHIRVYRNHKLDDKLTAYSRGLYQTGLTLEWLTDKLGRMRAPVILIFYGDHTPAYGYDMANDRETDGMTSRLRSCTTSFFIWSNYRKDHKHLRPLSLGLLGNELMNYIGLPLNRYQAFMEDFKTYSRGLGRDIILDADGKHITKPTDHQLRKIQDQWLLEYDVISGENYSGGRLADYCCSN
jgi:sulfatase-like protein